MKTRKLYVSTYYDNDEDAMDIWLVVLQHCKRRDRETSFRIKVKRK